MDQQPGVSGVSVPMEPMEEDEEFDAAEAILNNLRNSFVEIPKHSTIEDEELLELEAYHEKITVNNKLLEDCAEYFENLAEQVNESADKDTTLELAKAFTEQCELLQILTNSAREDRLKLKSRLAELRNKRVQKNVFEKNKAFYKNYRENFFPQMLKSFDKIDKVADELNEDCDTNLTEKDLQALREDVERTMKENEDYESIERTHDNLKLLIESKEADIGVIQVRNVQYEEEILQLDDYELKREVAGIQEKVKLAKEMKMSPVQNDDDNFKNPNDYPELTIIIDMIHRYNASKDNRSKKFKHHSSTGRVNPHLPQQNLSQRKGKPSILPNISPSKHYEEEDDSLSAYARSVELKRTQRQKAEAASQKIRRQNSETELKRIQSQYTVIESSKRKRHRNSESESSQSSSSQSSGRSLRSRNKKVCQEKLESRKSSRQKEKKKRHGKKDNMVEEVQVPQKIPYEKENVPMAIDENLPSVEILTNEVSNPSSHNRNYMEIDNHLSAQEIVQPMQDDSQDHLVIDVMEQDTNENDNNMEIAETPLDQKQVSSAESLIDAEMSNEFEFGSSGEIDAAENFLINNGESFGSLSLNNKTDDFRFSNGSGSGENAAFDDFFGPDDLNSNNKEHDFFNLNELDSNNNMQHDFFGLTELDKNKKQGDDFFGSNSFHSNEGLANDLF